MQPESLGKYAATLDFTKVSVQLIHGLHVEKKNTVDAMLDTDTASILYQAVDGFLFDHADIDEAIVKEIKHLATGLDRVQMSSINAGVSIAKKLLSSDFSDAHDARSKRLKRLLNEQIPSLIEWDIDGDSTIRVADFIQHQVPFQKTREWLFDRMTEISKSESDSFLSRITIKSGSIYAI